MANDISHGDFQQGDSQRVDSAQGDSRQTESPLQTESPRTTDAWQRLFNTAAVLIVGIAAGAFATAAWQGQLGAVSVDATASMGEDNFAIATGMVDNGLEGIFFLDYVTGDLRAAIISRRTGKFSGFFEYNVQADFGAQTQKPKYLMVTGLVDLPRGSGPSQVAQCVVYVAEATSGQVYAYALPYSGSLNAKGAPQNGSFILLDGGPFRTTFVRGQ